MQILLNQTKKEILDYINKNNGAFYGDIVRHLNYPPNSVMKNLVDMKKQGLVFKDNNGGQYKPI